MPCCSQKTKGRVGCERKGWVQRGEVSKGKEKRKTTKGGEELVEKKKRKEATPGLNDVNGHPRQGANRLYAGECTPNLRLRNGTKRNSTETTRMLPPKRAPLSPNAEIENRTSKYGPSTRSTTGWTRTNRVKPHTKRKDELAPNTKITPWSWILETWNGENEDSLPQVTERSTEWTEPSSLRCRENPTLSRQAPSVGRRAFPREYFSNSQNRTLSGGVKVPTTDRAVGLDCPKGQALSRSATPDHSKRTEEGREGRGKGGKEVRQRRLERRPQKDLHYRLTLT